MDVARYGKGPCYQRQTWGVGLGEGFDFIVTSRYVVFGRVFCSKPSWKSWQQRKRVLLSWEFPPGSNDLSAAVLSNPPWDDVDPQMSSLEIIEVKG